MSKVVRLDDYRPKPPLPPPAARPTTPPLWLGLLGMVTAVMYVVRFVSALR